tara:strand:- start:55 stop:873 length:819 start_codon:yes stop_codon:yes gene_type:complete
MPKSRLLLQKLEKIFFYRKYKLNTSIDLEKKTQELNDNGYLEINNIFSDIELNETIDYLSTDRFLEPIYTNHQKFNLKKPPSDAKTGYIDTNTLVKSKYILKAANNPNLLNILKSYFGCSFRLDWVWAWWSFPSKELAGPQLFHRDYESMNFLKVFVYLSDVDEFNGPHEYIIGSHKIDKLYKRERFSDQLIHENFEKDKILTIKGQKGKTFIANTFGIHRGLQPKNEKRLVLVYLFSVVPSNRSPKLPVLIKNELNFDLKEKKINSLFIEA